MNPKMFYWLGVGSAFAIGVITGVAGVRVDLERKLRKEYAEREQMMQNAYELALTLQTAEKPVLNELDLGLDKDLDLAIEGLEEEAGKVEGIEGTIAQGGHIERILGQDGETVRELHFKDNPYHKAVEATATTQEMFVEGGVNDYGVSYIEEEEYLEDDGRFKGKIDLIFDDHNPIFLMDGEPIDDWDKRLGDSILVDFYKLVPPGIDPILYVRNHKTDEDYEVVRISP